MLSTPVILIAVGSDCFGGAGIQADIKTISALRGCVASVIIAVTAQNTVGIQAVYPIPSGIVHMQTGSVTDDLQPVAVKIGMVRNAAIMRAIVECLQRFRPHFVVYDPAMILTSGRQLMTKDTIHTIQEGFFPLYSPVTPDSSEVSLLLARTVADVEDMKQAARELADRYYCAVLAEGDHLSGITICDVSYGKNGFNLFEQQKIESCDLHSTGYTLSPATATLVTCSNGLEDVICQAKAYIDKAILHGRDLHIEHGNRSLYHFLPEEE